MLWISIPQQTVKLPQGGTKVVMAFEIQSCPITAAEFALFAKQTGYVSAAEQRKDEYSVYRNPTFDQKTFKDWRYVEAVCLWYDDAIEFCRHHQAGLPTVEQWLSFAKYVVRHDLFAFPEKPEVPSVDFAGPEWLTRKSRRGQFVGRPPLKRIGELPRQALLPARLVSGDHASLLLGAAFRLVPSNKR